MRCDQQMGLPPEAIAYLAEHEVVPTVCPCCNRPYPKVFEKIGGFVGMFEDEYPLYRHQLKNGEYADEFLQDAPWNNGPCFFLGLKVPGNMGMGVNLKWPQSDIDEV